MTSGSAPSTGRGRAQWLGLLGSDGAALAAHLLSLVAAAVIIAVVDRHNWFWADEWDFIHRSLTGQLDVLASHNGQWSTIPILVWAALQHVFELRSYMPYVGVLIACHVVAVHLTWQVMRRLKVSAWIATAVAGVLAVNGSGFQDLVSAFQFTFIASVVFGLAALLVTTTSVSPRVRLLLTWILLLASLMCSNIGVGMVAAVAFSVALATDSLRRGLLAMSLPTASFVVWAVAEHASSGSTPGPRSDLLGLWSYVWDGITATASSMTGMADVGSIIVLALIAFLIWQMRSQENRRQYALAGGMFLACFPLMALAGVARITLGTSQSESSRYVYVLAILIAPTLAWALNRFPARRSHVQCAAVAAALVLASNGIWNLVVGERSWGAVTNNAEQTSLAGIQVAQASTLNPEMDDLPDSILALRASDARVMVTNHDLPQHVSIPLASWLTAENFFNVVLESHPVEPGTLATINGEDGTTVGAPHSGCAVAVGNPVQQQIHLEVGAPSPYSIQIYATSGVSVSSTLISGNYRSSVQTLSMLQSTEWLSVNSTYIMLLTFSGSQVTVCQLANS